MGDWIHFVAIERSPAQAVHRRRSRSRAHRPRHRVRRQSRRHQQLRRSPRFLLLFLRQRKLARSSSKHEIVSDRSLHLRSRHRPTRHPRGIPPHKRSPHSRRTLGQRDFRLAARLLHHEGARITDDQGRRRTRTEAVGDGSDGIGGGAVRLGSVFAKDGNERRKDEEPRQEYGGVSWTV